MLIGYARTSTADQNLDLQLQELAAAGCDPIFQEQASGADGQRPELRKAMSIVTAGSTLVVWRLDRLARSVRALVDLLQVLDDRGAHFRSLRDNMDTSVPTGRFIFHVIGAFAEMERAVIRERTLAGLAAARKRGRRGGRPIRMTAAKLDAAKALLADGMPVSDVARSIEVSEPTIYRWLPAGERERSGLRQVITESGERK